MNGTSKSSSIIVRFEILLSLFGNEKFPGLLRNRPPGSFDCLLIFLVILALLKDFSPGSLVALHPKKHSIFEFFFDQDRVTLMETS